MRGRIAARRIARELAMFGAWQAERFAREEKLKGFGHYARQATRAEREADRPPAAAAGPAMLASLLAIRNSGVPMTIRRLK